MNYINRPRKKHFYFISSFIMYNKLFLKMDLLKSYIIKINPSYNSVFVPCQELTKTCRYRNFNEKGQMILVFPVNNKEKKEIIRLRYALHESYKYYQTKNRGIDSMEFICIEFVLRIICAYIFYPDTAMDKNHYKYMESLIQKLIQHDSFFNLNCKNAIGYSSNFNYLKISETLSEYYRPIINMQDDIVRRMGSENNMTVIQVLNRIQKYISEKNKNMLPFIIKKHMLI